jgi:hypothetical protein
MSQEPRFARTQWMQAIGLLALACAAPAHAFTFELGEVTGSFDSTIGVGTGIRTQGAQCDLVTKGATGSGAPQGCLDPSSVGAMDQGDLNYRKGSAFTRYIKGTHELLLKMPYDITVMARGTWMRDFAADDVSGDISSGNALGKPLTSEAADDLRFKTRLLDAWVGKSFEVGERKVRVRLGNQVINWGESLFLSGGINSTNATDLQRLSLPGTQIKEGLLASPMLDAGLDLGDGLGLEAYYKFGWAKSYLPPAASYWSSATSFGVGNASYGVTEVAARNSGQFGLALRWQPASTELNMAAYFVKYHDNMPRVTLDANFVQTLHYEEDRTLLGLSANLPAGDWVLASELSYRPKDAVSLSTVTGCAALGGVCSVDEARYQWNVNGVYSMTRTNAAGFLSAVGADASNLLVEFGSTFYPDLKKSYAGIPISSGYGSYGLETSAAGTNYSVGNKFSAGVAADFSVTYDSSVLAGWQVTPGVYYYQGLRGRTPNVVDTFMQGTRTVNMYLSFVRSPGNWSVMANLAKFYGGGTFDNVVRDRDYFGLTASHTF